MHGLILYNMDFYFKMYIKIKPKTMTTEQWNEPMILWTVPPVTSVGWVWQMTGFSVLGKIPGPSFKRDLVFSVCFSINLLSQWYFNFFSTSMFLKRANHCLVCNMNQSTAVSWWPIYKYTGLTFCIRSKLHWESI